MKIYISGPISGTKDHTERFEKAERALTATGHTVINPERVNGQMPWGTTQEEYMRLSFELLSMCDTIFMLQGWQQSKGAKEELEYAVQNKHTIVFEGGRDVKAYKSATV